MTRPNDPHQIDDWIPPQDIEAEASLLGSMLLDRECIAGVFEIILRENVEWLYRPDHRMLFSAVVDLADADKPIDIIVLEDELRRRGQLDEIGGRDYLLDLVTSVPSAVNAAHYAGIVRDKGEQRDLIDAAGKLERYLRESDSPAPEVVSGLVDAISRATDGSRNASGIATTSQADRLDVSSIGRVLAEDATWEDVETISTGIGSLDNALGGGFRVGGVSLIAGKPGKAKTTVASQVAVNAASVGAPVGIVSLEMARRDVAHLIAANLSGVSRKWISDGSLGERQAEDLANAIHEVAAWPLTVLDDGCWRRPLTRTGLADLVSQGRNHCGWRIVILDYVGLLAREITDTSEYTADVATSTELKRIARRSDVALIVISSMRKSGNFKGAKDTPTLDDILGAGRLGYDAENILAVNCEQTGDPGVVPSGSVFIHPLKTRFSGAGSSGEILTLSWTPTTGRVFDAARSESEGPY